MGAITKFIRDLDPQKEVEGQLTETLNVLVKLAQSKLSGYKLEMNDSWQKGGNESLAPGATKDYQEERMHVMTTTDSSSVQDSIGKIVDSAFALGKSPDASSVGGFIKTLVGNGLDTVLGSGAAEENEYKQYVIYPDSNFLCRCDIWFWRYTMQAKGFQQKLNNVLVYRMQYGAVDIARVDSTSLAHWFDKWGLVAKDAKDMLERAKALVEQAKSGLKTPSSAEILDAEATAAPKALSDGPGLVQARAELMAARGL